MVKLKRVTILLKPTMKITTLEITRNILKHTYKEYEILELFAALNSLSEQGELMGWNKNSSLILRSATTIET